MNRFVSLLAALTISALIALGCSGGNNPVTPDDVQEPDISGTKTSESGTQLWGYYTVYLNLEEQEAEVTLNRTVMNTFNVVQFLNNNPANLGFSFNGTDPQPGHIDVDLDVSITHPIPSQPKFNGYDVRGALIADGTGIMQINSDLIYPVLGTDQFLMNADGYTRWYNKPEFLVPGLCGYTEGLYGSNFLVGNATLNGYKYFADTLGPYDDVFDWLDANPTSNGVFSSGSTNTRNYQIRFPVPTPGIQYDYAIIASWGGGLPEDHPCNAPETVACMVDVTDDLYWTPTTSGGDLILDFSLFNWEDLPVVAIEASVLSFPYEVWEEPEITANIAYWHIEIPADGILTTADNEFWIAASFPGNDYNNPFGIPNSADTDPLTAFFRCDLFVSDEPPPPNLPPVILDGVTGNAEFPVGATETYNVNAMDPDLDTLEYMWRVTDVSSGLPVFFGLGDGLGGFDVDWSSDVVAEIDDTFEIDCTVTDLINPPVDASTLTVVCTELPNLPPLIIDGVNGDSTAASDDVKEYTVTAVDPEADPLTYDWVVTDMVAHIDVYATSGVDMDLLSIDWTADIGATDGDIYGINCEVSDPFNPPVAATPLIVTISDSGAVTLYLYDGTVDDGGITQLDDGSDLAIMTWEYCPAKEAWDENECGPYGPDEYRLAKTPLMVFPDVGDFTTIHLELWHWSDMQDDVMCYGTLGVGNATDPFEPNWLSERLVYIEGFDHNDLDDYDDFSFIFGTEADPEWSHFNCDDYAGNEYYIVFGFGEYGAGNPDTQDGWNIRKLHVWYEP